MDKTLYSKLVSLKKKYIKIRIIPSTIGFYIDNFFNALHNARIQTTDITRDILVRTQDTVRDTVIQSKDIVRDTLIQTKDITKDALVQTKDTVRDTVIQSKDIVRDTLIQTKDITKDALVQTKDTVRDTAVETKNIIQETTHWVRCGYIKNFTSLIFNSIVLSKFIITEESDKEAVSYVQRIIANSQNVKNRITKYYSRNSTIIYPPVKSSSASEYKNIDVPKDPNSDNLTRDNILTIDSFWLSVNRIIPEKRIEMQIEAFKHLPLEKLVVIGGYDSYSRNYAQELFKECPANVFYIGLVDDTTLSNIYSSCIGLITTAVDEDFGMTAIEAMAAGKPVIAPNEGGYTETVIDGETGILIDTIDSMKIVESIQNISDNIRLQPHVYTKKCMERGLEFNQDVFIKKIKREIEDMMKS